MLIDKDDAIKAVCEACYMYKYIGEHYKDCKYYPCDDIKALEAIPSAEQVTIKLKNPCDSLLTEESNGSKEQKSKLDLISRELAMERIANDNVVGGLERIHEYNNSTEFNDYLDGISDAITTVFCDVPSADITETETCQRCQESVDTVLNRQGERIKELEASAEAVQGEWGHMIVDGTDGSHWYEYECSHCGEVVLRPYNFCPNCGAKMTKGGDSE